MRGPGCAIRPLQIGTERISKEGSDVLGGQWVQEGESFGTSDGHVQARFVSFGGAEVKVREKGSSERRALIQHEAAGAGAGMYNGHCSQKTAHKKSMNSRIAVPSHARDPEAAAALKKTATTLSQSSNKSNLDPRSRRARVAISGNNAYDCVMYE